MSNFCKRFWCIFFGFLTGTIVAKVYEIWAMLFSKYGNLSPKGWRVPPLWRTIVGSPKMTRVIITVLFILIAIMFSNCLTKKTDDQDTNNSTKI